MAIPFSLPSSAVYDLAFLLSMFLLSRSLAAMIPGWLGGHILFVLSFMNEVWRCCQVLFILLPDLFFQGLTWGGFSPC
jgi:hypothetical protein